ncbi:MAG: DUF1761 domain-containing protein [Actinomycetota bacterium]
MSFESLQDVYWPAVAVAAVAYFAMGGIWYIPQVMGTAWAKAGGVETAEQTVNPVNFIGTLVAYFVSGIATGMIAVSTGTDTAGEGAVLGLVVGVGYAFTAAAVTAIYDKKPDPIGWWLINGIFNVAGLVVMGLIIGAWQG